MVTQTISRDLDEINAKVKEASLNLRKERVRLIKMKVKEELGKDIDISVADVNTDVRVNLNLNDLAKTEGIVSPTNPRNLESMSSLSFCSRIRTSSASRRTSWRPWDF